MNMHKTGEGQRVLKDRSLPLTPRQRTALVMVDGRKSLADLLAATAAAGVAPDDVRKLVELGLIEERADPGGVPRVGKPAAAAGGDRFLRAYPAAVRLTAELGLKGVRLNMAVEAASSYEQLVALLPRLRVALKPERYAELEELLGN